MKRHLRYVLACLCLCSGAVCADESNTNAPATTLLSPLRLLIHSYEGLTGKRVEVVDGVDATFVLRQDSAFNRQQCVDLLENLLKDKDIGLYPIASNRLVATWIDPAKHVVGLNATNYVQRLRERRDEMLRDAMLARKAREGSADQYFPPVAFSSDKEQNAIHASAYTNELVNMREPSLYSRRSETNAQIYRFTCLRSLNDPFCIVVEVQSNDTAVITTKFATLQQGGGLGPLKDTKTATLAKPDVQALQNMLRTMDFWTTPSRDPNQQGLDGSSWILEGLDHGRYHVVARWSPEDWTYISRLGRFILKLSGTQVKELY